MPKRFNPKPPAAPPRPERLAFNLFDLDRVDPRVRARLLPLLDLRREAAAWVDRDRVDETAAPFACSLLLAAQACDAVRGMARVTRQPVPRVYLDRKGAGVWVRLPALETLTYLYLGRVVLNPVLFPGAADLSPAPLPP